jgi:hypothetical protein
MVRVTKSAFGQGAGVCLLTALVLGACSGGGSVSGAQEEQAKKANAICQDAQDAIGRQLGADPNKTEAALHTAADKLKALSAPSENENTWMLFVQSTNNLWLSALDYSQSLDPNVNDRARAQRALQRMHDNNALAMKYATEYHALECARGFGS